MGWGTPATWPGDCGSFHSSHGEFPMSLLSRGRDRMRDDKDIIMYQWKDSAFQGSAGSPVASGARSRDMGVDTWRRSPEILEGPGLVRPGFCGVNPGAPPRTSTETRTLRGLNTGHPLPEFLLPAHGHPTQPHRRFWMVSCPPPLHHLAHLTRLASPGYYSASAQGKPGQRPGARYAWWWLQCPWQGVKALEEKSKGLGKGSWPCFPSARDHSAASPWNH